LIVPTYKPMLGQGLVIRDLVYQRTQI